MNTNRQPNPIVHLQKRGYQRINKIRPGSKVFCDTGVLWVTQVNDRQDYILRSGDTMTVSKRGKVLVEAMREADFHIA